MKKPAVNQALIHREAWASPVLDILQSVSGHALAIVLSLLAGIIWPLALPLCLLFSLMAVMLFSLRRWRCPLRIPATLDIVDPSRDRRVRKSVFSDWFQYEDVEQKKADGIFYLGFRRLSDIGRELWLSMDDLTRHVMFFASTGGGKTETIYAWTINPLCWARGYTVVDGKAQNDTARTLYYLARRFGREDCVEVINFMNGGKSRSEIILCGDKSRPQSNTWNPFCHSTEAFTAETMQSMLPQNVQGGEWQSRAIAMNKALVFGTTFSCVRNGRVVSLQQLRDNMSLEALAGLYCTALDEQWPEDAIAPLRNYLKDVPGFDMALVRTPSEWTEEPRKQHAYLSGQFSETFATFTETFGDIFARDAGDIDLRDSIHSDRILLVMIPAMDTSSHTTSALGRMFVTQQSMILARDLGYRLEGTDSDTLEVKKYKGRFPYICFLDEVGAYYTDRIAVEATQVRSLEFALIMMAQDQERIEEQTSANNTATLMQNAGTKIAGRVVSDDKTAKTLKSAAGEVARAQMDSLQREDGLFGETWADGRTVNIKMESSLRIEELIRLQQGEHFTLFQGDAVPSASFYIPDKEKSTPLQPLVINRYITVNAPPLSRLARLVDRSARRRLPVPENVSAITGVLTAKPSRRRKKKPDIRAVIDTFQNALASRQLAQAILPRFDTDPEAREADFWKAATEVLRTTTRENRRIRYITLNAAKTNQELEIAEAKPVTLPEPKSPVEAEEKASSPEQNQHKRGLPVASFRP